ncbi:MAG: hypothetical protein WC045_01140 [Patescibacteria group bacterium]
MSTLKSLIGNGNNLAVKTVIKANQHPVAGQVINFPAPKNTAPAPVRSLEEAQRLRELLEGMDRRPASLSPGCGIHADIQ